MKGVIKALPTMAEPLHRCMYCGDSHGTDVEHFWPKGPYPRKMFEWANLLLCCAECNRIKGTEFPVNNSEALMIDPTSDDPWKHLDFDPMTGNISARFCTKKNEWDIRGEKTVACLELDRRETLSKVLLKFYRRLLRIAVESNRTRQADLEIYLEADDTGLLEWILFGSGASRMPFSDLVQSFPSLQAEYAKRFR